MKSDDRELGIRLAFELVADMDDADLVTELDLMLQWPADSSEGRSVARLSEWLRSLEPSDAAIESALFMWRHEVLADVRRASARDAPIRVSVDDPQVFALLTGRAKHAGEPWPMCTVVVDETTSGSQLLAELLLPELSDAAPRIVASIQTSSGTWTIPLERASDLDRRGHVLLVGVRTLRSVGPGPEGDDPFLLEAVSLALADDQHGAG